MNVVLERQGLHLLRADEYKLLYMALTRATEQVTIYTDLVFMEILTRSKHSHDHIVKGEKDIGIDHMGRSWYFNSSHRDYVHKNKRESDKDHFLYERRARWPTARQDRMRQREVIATPSRRNDYDHDWRRASVSTK